MLQVYTYEVRPKGIIITGFSQVRIKGIVGGRGLGVVCEHMNHFCYHTKEIRILNAWGGLYAEGEHCYSSYSAPKLS